MSTAEPVVSLPTDQSIASNGARVIYDRTTLLALASSQLARVPPNEMAQVPGITKGNNAQDKSAGPALAGASPYRKILERKKEEQEKKKTFNPFALLNEDE
ncbi:hypothetical protein [Absidia glauca]|uniref:Uncharacterized protein n=1 Tax=Absidia glauca TaxID=4829 RepID=A0A163LW52_ABSGL|nr:hypothetical protein [Absidia glauca]